MLDPIYDKFADKISNEFSVCDFIYFYLRNK